MSVPSGIARAATAVASRTGALLCSPMFMPTRASGLGCKAALLRTLPEEGPLDSEVGGRSRFIYPAGTIQLDEATGNDV